MPIIQKGACRFTVKVGSLPSIERGPQKSQSELCRNSSLSDHISADISQAFTYCFPLILNAIQLRLGAMEYKGFVVRAFEREQGKWRATIRRPHGIPLKAKDQRRLYCFVTSRDTATATDAVLLALEAIDTGSFSRNTVRSTEKFWRRSQQCSAPNIGRRST
jgi:hypothetical protein